MSSVSLGRSRNSDIAARTPQCDGPAFGASSASTYSRGDAIADAWRGVSLRKKVSDDGVAVAVAAVAAAPDAVCECVFFGAVKS